MVRRKDVLWVLLFVVACVVIVVFLYYVYLFKPSEYKLPKFSWVEILLIFVIGFFPSTVSRFVANILSEQIDMNFKGFVSTVKDLVYGWIFYYVLLIIAFIVYDWIVWQEFPSFW